MSPRRRKPDDDPRGLADALARWDSAQDWMRQREQADPSMGHPDERGHAAPGELFAERVPGQPGAPDQPGQPGQPGRPPGAGGTGQWPPPNGPANDPRGPVPADPRADGWAPAGQPTAPGEPPNGGASQPDLTQVIRPDHESTPWGGPAWGGGQPPPQPAPDHGQGVQPAPQHVQPHVPPPVPPGPLAGQHAVSPPGPDSGQHPVPPPPGPDSGRHAVPPPPPGRDSGRHAVPSPPAGPESGEYPAVDTGQHAAPGPDPGQPPPPADSGPVPVVEADRPTAAGPDQPPAAVPPGPAHPEAYPPVPAPGPYPAAPHQGWSAPPGGQVEPVPPGGPVGAVPHQSWSAPPGGQVEQWPAVPVPAAPPAEWQRQGWTEPGQRGAPSAADLASHALVRSRKPTPSSGWRKAIYTLSGHAVNPGESPADIRRRELLARATMPVRGCYRIAMISLKGGVGKTTMSVCLGSTLASLRGDRVIAVDANPDRGTLSGKIPLETVATIRNLLNDADAIGKYSDVRRYTSQSPDRLEVLASETDPAVSTAFSEADYHVVAGILERFYNVVITDCGTGLLHSAMTGVLALANQLVVVSSGSVDGARSASATLDWLEAHGRGDMVAGAVAVINSVRPKSGGVDLDKLREHFAARCREVTCIPYDPHLEEGAEVDLSQLRGETRNALLEFSAYVADGFPRP